MSQRWWVAVCLFLATVINYVDRQTLSVLAPVLTDELKITNVEYSYMVQAFLIPYTFMYIPAGILIDRWGTRAGMAVSMVWWSIATATSRTWPARARASSAGFPISSATSPCAMPISPS